jgi:para-aminobenzoate synthetase/4-amino-4-deoxychorismate lyase
VPEPFVLLDFPGGRRVLRKPRHIIEARLPGDVAPALASLEGQAVAGCIAYEAGLALDRRLEYLSVAADPASPPLLWFAAFEEEVSDLSTPDPAGAWLGKPRPLLGERDFHVAVAKIHEHLLAGDIYQANFTFQADVSVAGHPLAVYEQMKSRARAAWGGVVFTGSHWILSCSPELFFTFDQGELVTRPMKGTAPAGSDPHMLSGDEKQRAENLMIVDLMRNDLARVCVPGSVKVPDLFTVERFPTVLQMTSTVTGCARPEITPVDVLKTLFPCGSVTGAPKVRAMELIDAIEAERRGPYTGSIGLLSADHAAFNVAIRTLVLADGSNVARVGLGSGIVADSDAASEWHECAAKGAFIATPGEFQLIETVRVAERQAAFLGLHLDRLESSALSLDFLCDRERIRSALTAEAANCEHARLRLVLSRNGSFQLQRFPMPENPANADVKIVARTADKHDFRLRHKTSLRSIYDEPLRQAGSFEILFADPEGFLTEGSFTNIFMERDGRLVTPPCSRGLLPGVLRRHLIESGRAIEDDIHVRDLNDHIFVGNALRGLIKVRIYR